jgi:hypothetical protein
VGPVPLRSVRVDRDGSIGLPLREQPAHPLARRDRRARPLRFGRVRRRSKDVNDRPQSSRRLVRREQPLDDRGGRHAGELHASIVAAPGAQRIRGTRRLGADNCGCSARPRAYLGGAPSTATRRRSVHAIPAPPRARRSSAIEHRRDAGEDALLAGLPAADGVALLGGSVFSRGHALKPATKLASGSASSIRQRFETESRASPLRARARTSAAGRWKTAAAGRLARGARRAPRRRGGNVPRGRCDGMLTRPPPRRQCEVALWNLTRPTRRRGIGGGGARARRREGFEQPGKSGGSAGSDRVDPASRRGHVAAISDGERSARPAAPGALPRCRGTSRRRRASPGCRRAGRRARDTAGARRVAIDRAR